MIWIIGGIKAEADDAYLNGAPAYVLDYDFLGQSRGATPVAGPFEGLKAGLNRIKVW